MLDLLGQPVPEVFARIAVERGIDRYPDGLTYGVPDDLSDLAEGDRVVVPLGRGDTPTPGYVIEILTHADAPPDRIKLIDHRDEHGVRLPGSLMGLARWVSSYYCTPIGMTLASMLPAAVKHGVGTVRKQMIDLGAPLPLPTPEKPAPKLPPKQRAVLEYLAGLDAAARPVEIRALADAAGLKTVGPIKKLLEAGFVESVHRTSIEAAWEKQAVDTFTPDVLSPAQLKVMADLIPRLEAGFSTHLLFGVTGSGKTEIYIRLMERVLAAGRTAIMLVPEISLTPQTAGRLIGRFRKRRIAILHSGLTAAQRNQQWSLAMSGEADIVLGARSAIFAPLPDENLGLIIVDEEHDGSYKQDQAPRYHGRDVAIRRAQRAGCPVLLGSATPSLESWHNATGRGVYHLHQLPQRVPGVRLPRVHVVDFAAERRKRTDKRVHLLGPVLEEAVGRTLASGAQALLLLNRRGYANYIACPDQRCGWVMTCDHCDVTMVHHKHGSLPSGGFVRCHHCDAEQRLPKVCPDCGRKISTFGLGTQRVEEELARKFPQLDAPGAMARVDSDTMRSAKDFHDVLGRFGDGSIRVLVGTQMIAKGLHYPNVRLVGVINADTAINLPDFRATERTFQLVSQVAGRSGRGEGPDGSGVVIVQSFHTQTPAIQLAAAHDYPSFARREIEERKACGLPPTTRMARIVVRDEDHVRAFEGAKRASEGLRGLAGASIRVRGPAPCPISRIAGYHRQQVEILAATAKELQELLTSARNRGIIAAGSGMAIDVDPIALL
jgi:primosomal protein N' (replication factor Y)